MPLGQTTYEDYLKEWKRTRGKTRTRLTRQAWETHRQMQQQGAAPRDIDISMGKLGLSPSPFTQNVRKSQKEQGGLIELLNRLRGMGR